MLGMERAFVHFQFLSLSGRQRQCLAKKQQLPEFRHRHPLERVSDSDVAASSEIV